MVALKVRHLESEIVFQVFFSACNSSSEVLGLAARTTLFTSIQIQFYPLQSNPLLMKYTYTNIFSNPRNMPNSPFPV